MPTIDVLEVPSPTHRVKLWWVPDAISFSRGGLALIDAWLLWRSFDTGEGWPIVTALTLTLMLTDWVDGLAARILNACSEFGAMLDTVMDKFAVALLLLIIAIKGAISPNVWINWGVFAAIVGREVLIIIGRPLLKRYMDIVMSVQQHGRFKMWVQGAAIVAVPLSHWFLVGTLPWGEVVPGLFWAAAATTLQSLYSYAKDVSARLKQLAS